MQELKTLVQHKHVVGDSTVVPGWSYDTCTHAQSVASEARFTCELHLPFSKQFQPHKGEHQHTEHEEEEDIEDLWQGITNAPERPAQLRRIKEHYVNRNTYGNLIVICH